MVGGDVPPTAAMCPYPTSYKGAAEWLASHKCEASTYARADHELVVVHDADDGWGQSSWQSSCPCGFESRDEATRGRAAALWYSHLHAHSDVVATVATVVEELAVDDVVELAAPGTSAMEVGRIVTLEPPDRYGIVHFATVATSRSGEAGHLTR